MKQAMLPPEVAREMENSPVLQNYYAMRRLEAESEAQEAMNAKRELDLKHQEVEELRRKNELEEQRVTELLKMNTKLDTLYVLITRYLDDYIEKHHEPINDLLLAIHARIESILQSLLYIIPELLKGRNDPRLVKLHEKLIGFMEEKQHPNTKGHVNIHVGEALSNFRTESGDIRDMTVHEK